jgi:hypothetical protein
MLGTEQHHAKRTDHIGHLADLESVMLHDPTRPAAEQTYGQSLLSLRILKYIDDMSTLLAKADHFRLLDGAKALAERREVDCLEEIGLTLGVVAPEKVDSGLEHYRRLADVTEVFNFYFFAYQGIENLLFSR